MPIDNAPINPVCPSCGLGCGTRRCKPRVPDVCCENCPEVNRLRKVDRAEVLALQEFVNG